MVDSKLCFGFYVYLIQVLHYFRAFFFSFVEVYTLPKADKKSRKMWMDFNTRNCPLAAENEINTTNPISLLFSFYENLYFCYKEHK